MAGYVPSAIQQCQRQCTRTAVYRRAFTSSCKRPVNGSLINFQPSSSPELDAIFASARNLVFFPNHLRRVDRSQMYRESQHNRLVGDEPIIVAVDTVDALDSSKTAKEEVQLEPRQFFDRPSTRKMLRDIIRLAETREDWIMVSAFLQEHHAAKRKLDVADVARLIRAAAEKGQYKLVINMFRQCKQTGLYFHSREVGTETMLLCLRQAYANGWEQEQLDAACKDAESALSLMIQPAHAPRGINSGQATKPEVLGCALALASVRSAKFHNFQDEDGKVLDYARRFLKSWPIAQIPTDQTKMHATNLFLKTWSPAWMGIQLAQRIVKDPEVLQGLSKILKDVLGPAVNQARDTLQNDSLATGAERERVGMAVWKAMSVVLEK